MSDRTSSKNTQSSKALGIQSLTLEEGTNDAGSDTSSKQIIPDIARKEYEDDFKGTEQGVEVPEEKGVKDKTKLLPPVGGNPSRRDSLPENKKSSS